MDRLIGWQQIVVRWLVVSVGAFALGFLTASVANTNYASRLENELEALRTRLTEQAKAATAKATPTRSRIEEPHFDPGSSVTPRFDSGAEACGKSPGYLYPYLSTSQNLVALSISEKYCRLIPFKSVAVALDEAYEVSFSPGGEKRVIQALRFEDADYFVTPSDWRRTDNHRDDEGEPHANR